MGNQCCQSASTTSEEKIQINTHNVDAKLNKQKSRDKTQEIDQKIDNVKQINSSHSKEMEYQNGNQEKETQQNSNVAANQEENQKQKSMAKEESIKQELDQNSNNKQQSLKNKKTEEPQVEKQKTPEVQQAEEQKQEENKKKEEQQQNKIQNENQKENNIENKQNNEPNNNTNGTSQQNGTAKNGDQKDAQKRSNSQKQSQKQEKQGASQLNSRAGKPKQSIKDFSVSADLFIHLKQGNIGDEYSIGETLGEGAFGHVSKVIHKNTKMVRAMKCIKKSSLIKEEEQKLFSEMNILKNLDHPNIVRLYELYQDTKCYYLICEYCSGGELFDKIKSLTHFTEKMAAEYMKQLLSSIFYCHQNKIVHRDLKPENLILESDKKGAILKVIDFGTSRKFDSAKKMTKRLGTPYYIAPEVLSQKYDEKCDVWSCGVILYILLCGYPPFGGRSEEEILKRVKQGKVRFDPEDWDKMSNESKTLIKKMLTIDPKKRLSAEQALNDQWIQKNAPSLPISSKALSSLSQFYTKSKLKQTVMTFIVSQIVSKEEKEELQKTFRQLDKNGDGRLSKQELIEGYSKVYGDKEHAIQHVERIMKMVDTNNSGVVDFTEFLMAAMQREQMLSKQKIETAFKMFDQDGNGYITREELQGIIGEIDDGFWKQILSECDTNKDGKISQNEFIELLMKKKV